MRATAFVPFAIVAALVFASVPSVAQVRTGVETGIGTGAATGPDGPTYYWTPHPGRAYLDPGLVEGFDVELSQIAILVVDPNLLEPITTQLARLGIDHHAYDRLSMIAVVLTKDQLTQVEGIDGVLIVYRNEHMSETLDKATAYVGAPTVWNTYKQRGEGVTILIVDSGVDGTHPDVKYKENLIENVVTAQQTGSPLIGGVAPQGFAATDADGHGTHVASIAGGTAKGGLSGQDAGKYHGLAWGGKLVGFQAGITNDKGEVSFQSTTVLEAFNYAIAKKKEFGIGVVSNSWGANGDYDVNSPINIATLQMYKAGLVVAFAAGNEGDQGAHTLNKYSVSPWVLSVTAGDYLNHVASFSSRGTDPAVSHKAYDHPDIMAPGVGITAAKAVTANACLTCADSTAGGYTSKSGTSMATPVVSGIAALLLAAKPNLSPDDVMDILVASATRIDGNVWDVGAGYVNALKAYQLAEKTTGSRTTFLAGTVKYAGRESGDPSLARDAVTVGYGEGAAQRLSSGAQTVDEFGNELVASVQGYVFLGGVLLLAVMAFRFGGSRRSP